MAFLVACGGLDDSSDGSSNGSGGSGDGKANSAPGGGTQKSKSGGVIPELKDGAFQKGAISLEITGDKRATPSLEGGGFAQSGLLVLTYGNGNNDAGAFLTFVDEKSDDEGGMAITTKGLATAGAWGKECDVTVSVQGDKVSGDFQCSKIDAVVPGEAKAFKITVKGKFTAER